MIEKEDWKIFVFVLAIFILTLARSLSSNGSAVESSVKVAPAIEQPNRHLSPPILEAVRRTISASGGLDQTATAPEKNRVSIVKPESPQADRALALAHSAIADAVHAVIGNEKRDRGRAPAAIVAVIAETANVTMTDFFPPQAARLDGGVLREVVRIGAQETDGVDVMQFPAEAERSSNTEPHARVGLIARNDLIKLRQDPISRFLRALSAQPEEVAPSS